MVLNTVVKHLANSNIGVNILALMQERNRMVVNTVVNH